MQRTGTLFLTLIASALLSAASAQPEKSAAEKSAAEKSSPEKSSPEKSSNDAPAPAAQPEGKPACTAANAGQQWPEEAYDPVFAAALAPYGYPMLCTHTASGYAWRSVRVPYTEQPKKSDKAVRTNPPASSKRIAAKDQTSSK